MNDSCSVVPPLCWDSRLESIGYLYIHLPIAVMGIVTNILNLLVLQHAQFRARVTVFTLLQAMALADLCACVTIFPIGLCRCIEPDAGGAWQTHLQQFYEIYIYLPLSNWFGCCSVWLTSVVSFERYFCVAYPLKAKQVWTVRLARVIIAAIFVSSLLMYVPYFFLREIRDSPPPGYTDWGTSHGAEVYSWIRMLIVKTIPITLVALTNGLLLSHIWRLQKRRNTLVRPMGGKGAGGGGRSELQVRATAMVLSISAVFLLCHIVEPFSHSGLFSTLFGVCSLYNEAHRTLLITTNILEVFSYATNFFFYCVFNKQFRGVLRHCCCPASSAPLPLEHTHTHNVPPTHHTHNTRNSTPPMHVHSVM
jgi:hypothetical protein